MRRAARIDDNHNEVVGALRQIPGVTVLDLAVVGKGCPDLLVGFRGRNYLMEIKDGSKPPSRRRLTDDQVAWHENWTGQAVVVHSADQAVEYLTKAKED